MNTKRRDFLKMATAAVGLSMAGRPAIAAVEFVSFNHYRRS